MLVLTMISKINLQLFKTAQKRVLYSGNMAEVS